MEGDYLHNRFMSLCVVESHQQTQNEIEVSSVNWHCMVESVESHAHHIHLHRNEHCHSMDVY